MSKNIECQLLNTEGKTFMCTYLGMDDSIGDVTKIMFMINGESKEINLSRDDMQELAMDLDGGSPLSLDEAQTSVDSWLNYAIAQFIYDRDLYY